MSAIVYETGDNIARLTLDRPDRGNGINRALVTELEDCVERADLDPSVRVLLLAGNGKGFCGGYDLVESAEGQGRLEAAAADGGVAGDDGAAGHDGAAGDDGAAGHDGAAGDDGAAGHDGAAGDLTTGAGDSAPPPGSPLDPQVMMANHAPGSAWDPMVDYAMMSRNVRAFMRLFHCSKPVVCKVHGFCVAGGTDLALCSDLLVIADDAKIGYPPARVWGSPTTAMWAYRLGAQRAKRLLFTGDSLSGAEALQWGLAVEAPPAAELDHRTEALVGRIAGMPLNQLQMMKLLVNQSLYSQGLHATQVLGTVFDGVARHTPEGYQFQGLAAREGFRAAVLARDQPFGDAGPSTFKG